MATHTIRLNGPWQVHLSRTGQFADAQSAFAVDSSDIAAVRIQLPVDWASFLQTQTARHFCYVRSFNFPASLQSDEVLRICFAQISPNSIVRLNDVTISLDEAGSADITAETGASNRLKIYWSRPPTDRQFDNSDRIPFSGVTLEIVSRD